MAGEEYDKAATSAQEDREDIKNSTEEHKSRSSSNPVV
jgi:hypothetical protein